MSQNSLKQNILVVSGLPRSGTSMMMKILDVSGFDILTDNLRKADANNPKGYYEFERAKLLKDGDSDWLRDAVGKAVKIISWLIMFLPQSFQYKVIFMQRDLEEILSSQKKMLTKLNKGGDNIPDQKMKIVFQRHLDQVTKWISDQPNMQVLNVNYNALMKNPIESLRTIKEFLGGEMDIKTMANAIDQELYRERKV